MAAADSEGGGASPAPERLPLRGAHRVTGRRQRLGSSRPVFTFSEMDIRWSDGSAYLGARPDRHWQVHAAVSLIHRGLLVKRPVVAIDPNDLIADLLARIPESRRDDVVLLDCLDQAPVGINPLMRHGRSPELVADSLLGMFQSLYGEVSDRATDILANCLNVLARRDDASLVMLLLLTNTGLSPVP